MGNGLESSENGDERGIGGVGVVQEIEVTQGNNRGGRRCKRLIKCATINAQSLENKMSELRAMIGTTKPGIVSVTETWGKSEKPDSVYDLEGYNLYRNDRSDGYGGTILYIRKGIDQRVCRPLNTLGFDNSAWCWIIEKGGKKTLVGSIYRSPNSTEENNKLLLDKILLANEIAGDNRVLILGDFNLPNIDWEEKELRRGARRIEEQMLDVVNDCFLFQHVKEDTRFRNIQASSLDLIFTKEERDVKNIVVDEPLGGSDHGIVWADYVSEWRSRVVHKPRRMYSKGNYVKINEELDQINWDEEFGSKSIHECWIILKAKLEELVNKYIPMSNPKDYNEPWMNNSLLKQWKKKYHAWKRYTAGKSYRKYEEYKKEANLLKKKIRQAKRAYEKKLAKGIRHNKRGFFKYVNKKLTVRPEISEMQNVNGVLVDNDKEIASIMGGYFNSVYKIPGNEDMPELNDMYEREINNIEITRIDVQKRLEKLNVNKTCGPDNIHPRVLQETARATSVPLEKIFKLSLDSGECPDDWRSANVTPIHKKGDRTDPGNYRPVSLTSQVCKVLESIVRKHILQHLDANNILSDKQHGFREGRSCLTNLLELVENWTDILDQDDGIDVAYLDFRKAFDLVSHRHLIHKMSKYGIKGQVLDWVKAFLSDRKQKVVIRGTASESFDVTSGVPQGSVLGPILFLIFINDLPLEVISPVSLFADDTKIFTRIAAEMNQKKLQGEYGSDVLQKDLDNIEEWANKWKMEFNVSKCKIMHLGSSNPGHTYTMGGANLTTTTEEKDLGVIFDDRLEFDKHIRGMVNRANRMLGMIKSGFDCMDKEIFKLVYPVLVRPLLEYCVQVWTPYKQKYIDLIEGVQKRAVKLVPGMKVGMREMTYDEKLVDLKLTRLVERRFRGDMIETYKIVTNKEGVNPGIFFKMNVERGDAELNRGLVIWKPRSSGRARRRYTFSQRVVNPWNRLSKEEVQKIKTSAFKKKFDSKEVHRRAARRNRVADGTLYKLLYVTDGVA